MKFLIFLTLGSLFGFCSVNAGDYDFWNELGQLFGVGEYGAPSDSGTGEEEVCLAAGSDMQGICTDPDACQGMALGYGNCTEPNCCCVGGGSCNDNSSQLIGYYTSPNYPQTFTGMPTKCPFQVCRYNSSICMVRLDFQEFDTLPPEKGKCENDTFTAEGLGKPLCGKLTGQHIILPFTKDTLDIDSIINQDETHDRKWKIKVTQIPCTVPQMRSYQHKGCLQEFRDVAGTINSFNFIGFKKDDSPDDMIDLSYTICIYMPRGFCEVEFHKSTITLHFGAEKDPCAEKPYIVIPNNGKRDRYCGKYSSDGTKFPDTLKSDQSPLIIAVNSKKADNFSYGGFSIKYRQKPCKLNS